MPPAKPPLDYHALLSAADITPDTPLYVTLVAAFEAATTARDVVGTSARGLTPQGEAELIRRVTAASAQAAGQEATAVADATLKRYGGRAAALMVAMFIAGLGLGRWWGVSGAGEAMTSASFVAQVAALNNAADLKAACNRTAEKDHGGVICTLPKVWISFGAGL